MSKLILIDGNAIMHRAYHALPPLTTKSGEPINAVYGFISMLLGIIADMKPTHLAVCFDRPEKTFRREKYIHYQAQRPEMDDLLVTQITKMHGVLQAFKIPVYEKAGYEADDLLGTIAKLITKKVKVYFPIKGIKEGKLYGVSDVKHEFDFEPIKMIDYKSLVGDSSDNYPGVTGIGPKTAIGLLNKFQTKQNIYKHLEDIPEKTRTKLEQGKDMADMSYDLATIRTNVPVEVDIKKMGDWDLGSMEAIRLFMSYGFRTLLGRITNGNEVAKVAALKKDLKKRDVEEVAIVLAKKLKNGQFAIRGTANMVLQGLDMGVADIDLIADKDTALSMNKIFNKELLEEVKFSEADKFRSYFGKFVIKGVLVEMMGEFQVKDKNGVWSEKLDASEDEVVEIKIAGNKVKVTRLDLEMKFSAMMGRFNELNKIKKQVDLKLQGSLF